VQIKPLRRRERKVEMNVGFEVPPSCGPNRATAERRPSRRKTTVQLHGRGFRVNSAVARTDDEQLPLTAICAG
jgi:hypothetical protein